MNSLMNKSRQSINIENNSSVQLFCAFHKDKLITNFCINQECLLPMCPTCVSIHNQQHREENTHGEFLSLQEIIHNTQHLLIKSNKSLEQLSEQYTEDYWNKQKILQGCKQILNNQKKKLIKQIQRKFQQIEYKMVRKINLFQDNIHDRYKELQTEIQYLYDSLTKQKQEISLNNDKILKNLIFFYSQKKEDKIKDWLRKFRESVDELKLQSIRIKCNDQIFDLVKSLEYYFVVEEFRDQENEYLISTGRELISSNTKRKRIESPRWSNENKQNMASINTVRYNTGGNANYESNPTNKTNQNIVQAVLSPTVIEPNTSRNAAYKQSNSYDYDIKNQFQWSVNKL